MQITLTDYEQIAAARSAQLRDETNAALEGRLFDALIGALGYDRANAIPNLGEYADELLCDCLTGKVAVLDEEAA